MPVKIRLQRKGRKKSPFYHIVAADSRAPRDGRFIEKLGTYNPMTKPATIELDTDRAYTWLTNGAQPTETARAILRFKGVLYRKHLQRGVAKGALTQEQADAKHAEWVEAKESKVAARFEQTAAEKEAFRKLVAGTTPEKKPEPVAETVAEATEAAAEEAPAEPESETAALDAAVEAAANEGQADEEKAE